MTISILIFSTMLIATRAWRAHAREGLNPLICGGPTDRCTQHGIGIRNRGGSGDTPDKGALASAPKNAPAWRTETTFELRSFALLVSLTPFLMIPKWFWKYGCATTPPPTPLVRMSEYGARRGEREDSRIVSE